MINILSGELRETTDDNGKRLAYVHYSGETNLLYSAKSGKLVFGVDGEPYVELVQYVPDTKKVALEVHSMKVDEEGNPLLTVKRYPVTSFSMRFTDKELQDE
jgi:hypothetical protein